ncbi:MAG: hypothetical protein ACJAYU_000128 [Bradymonadia bacterium]|jgi:hypothetical protein
MIPEALIIEEQRRRREREWQPIPLHAPSPLPLQRIPRREEVREEVSRSSVIIIDISNYSETPL